jgi:hypothetical protein
MILVRVRGAMAIACVMALLAACTPKTEEVQTAEPAPSGADAITPGNPYFGNWTLSAAKIAPWWDEKGDTPVADPAFSKFTLAADKSSGPPLLTCDKPRYALNMVPPRGLFEGGLPDPVKEATALGFTSSSITVMNFSCQSGNADISLEFPMIDDDTILLGLDNVIYTFKRTNG